MRPMHRTSRRTLTLLILSLFLTFLARCGEAPSETVAPAHVEHPPVESELSKVTLTEQAVERLGIETTEIELREVSFRSSWGRHGGACRRTAAGSTT